MDDDIAAAGSAPQWDERTQAVMSQLSRRALLRGAGASAAVVPAIALGANKSFAATASPGSPSEADDELDAVEAVEVSATGR